MYKTIYNNKSGCYVICNKSIAQTTLPKPVPYIIDKILKKVIIKNINLNQIEVDREFYLYIPNNYNNIKMPVLFIFHGYSGNALKFMNDNLKKLADQHKFMIISVQGALLDSSDIFSSHFNNSKMNSKTSKSNSADFNFIQKIITYLDSNYKNKIDNTKLWCMGFSNGGSFVYKLLTYNNNLPLNYRFSSFVTIAGNMLVELQNISNNYNFKKLLIIHDIYDTVSPYTSNNDVLGVEDSINELLNTTITINSNQNYMKFQNNNKIIDVYLSQTGLHAYELTYKGLNIDNIIINFLLN